MAGDSVTVKMGGSSADVLKEIDKIIQKQIAAEEGFGKIGKAAKKSGDDIGSAAKSGEQFGAKVGDSMTGLMAKFAGFTSIFGAVEKGIEKAIEGMQKYIDLGKEGAASLAADRGPLASLAQQAKSPADMKRLMGLAEEMHTKGGADSIEQAKNAVAQLNALPGGLKSLPGLTKLKAAGVISDVGGLVKSESAAQFGFGGEAKSGSLDTLTGKALAAAQASGGMASAEGIMGGTAAAAKVARQAGLSPDEVMAAVTTISRTGTDATEAGSQVAALERKINANFPKLRGKPLKEQIESINAMHLSPKKLQEKVGREGRAAMGALGPNMGEYTSTLDTISKAGPDVAAEKIAMVAAQPNLSAAQMAEANKREAEETKKEKYGNIGSIAEAVKSGQEARMNKKDAGWMERWQNSRGFLESDDAYIKRELQQQVGDHDMLPERQAYAKGLMRQGRTDEIRTSSILKDEDYDKFTKDNNLEYGGNAGPMGTGTLHEAAGALQQAAQTMTTPTVSGRIMGADVGEE